MNQHRTIWSDYNRVRALLDDFKAEGVKVVITDRGMIVEVSGFALEFKHVSEAVNWLSGFKLGKEAK